MKGRNIAIFFVILCIILFASYVFVNGITIGDYRIEKAKDSIELGLDLAGGVYVMLEAQTDQTGAELQRTMEQTKAIINNRVNGLGISEPNIAIEGGNRLRIELAGMEDPDKAIDLIGQTAQLQFIDPDENVILTGKNVKASEVTYSGNSLTPDSVVVSLEFDAEGTEAFAKATEKLAPVRGIIRIELDGKVISAPSVESTIPNGKAVIQGKGFTLETANELSTLIRAGALPVKLEALRTSVIGPTLGINSYEKSINATGLALLIIFVFMIIMYKVPGFIAALCLMVYIIITVAAMILLHAKLTLPGIAGFILSIGMAVDANVLIFERIREELNLGKTLHTSIQSGFKSALRTVMDSNITTLLAGVVLYKFGVGPIKGFGVTLILGIVSSMITAVILTKLLLKLSVDVFGKDKVRLYGASSK